MSYDYEDAMGMGVSASTMMNMNCPRGTVPSILGARWGGSADEIKAKIASYQVGGPYHLIEASSPDYQAFMQWAQIYYQKDQEKYRAFRSLRPIDQYTLDAIKRTTGEDIQVPAWMKTGIKVLESEWRLFVECRDRALKMVRDQGVTPLAVGGTAFIEWWRKHDNCGLAGFFANAGGERGFMLGIPAGLFNFYLETGGSAAPPAHLLGKGLNIKAWLERNWMMLGLGAVGGIVIGGAVIRRRRLARAGAPREGLVANATRGVRDILDPYGEGDWEEVWDPKLKAYVVAPFGGTTKPKGPRTKREMRKLGYKYDLYTGEKL
jgi:hypothetical protein